LAASSGTGSGLEQVREPEDQADQRPEGRALAELVQNPRHPTSPVSVCIVYVRILFLFYSKSQAACFEKRDEAR
jgi:hypothetical protein